MAEMRSDPKTLIVANIVGPVVATETSPKGPTPPSDLPSGWTAHFDVSSGKFYFLNTATGETTWEMPAVVKPFENQAGVGTGPAAGSEDELANQDGSFRKYEQFRGFKPNKTDDVKSQAGVNSSQKIACGQCLCRISLKSILTHDWKPCFWILEADNCLHVFRDKNDYTTFHENSFLDEKTRNFLLKANIELTGQHRFVPMVSAH
jgi:hypothetical protein